MATSSASEGCGGLDAASAALGLRGYRRQPPPGLLARTQDRTPFASFTATSWAAPLLAGVAPGQGGAHTVRWSVRTSRPFSVPVAIPPSAQRVLSAVWRGRRPYGAALEEVTTALARSGLKDKDLRYVVTASPEDIGRPMAALRQLGVPPDDFAVNGTLAGAPRRMRPALGPLLAIEFPVGPPCSAGCTPGCRCGRYLLLAYLHFRTDGDPGRKRAQTPHLFEAVVLESAVLCAVHGIRDPYALPGFAPLTEYLRTLMPPHEREGLRAQRVRLLADRVFTSALLLGVGASPGPRGPAHVMRRLLRQAACELELTGSPPAELGRLVHHADRLVRVPLGFQPLAAADLQTVHREAAAFQRVLADGYPRLALALRRDGTPEERARTLLWLRSVHGVPVSMAMSWCRDRELDVSLTHFAAAELADRERAAPASMSGTAGPPAPEEAGPRLL
ncbi:alanine--tRNA ligase-related protein [Streptomyces sp. NPDC051569]|uniref:alanine--tRNA ligase-related protein n=1 Tax=Streptomyces sp. NPDC051569 TaxID=3365661 RepID=UPI0037BDF27F